MTAEPYRAKTTPLLRPSILFRPRMVEAPGTAPGSEPPILRSVYRHSRLPGRTNIGHHTAELKADALLRPREAWAICWRERKALGEGGGGAWKREKG